MSKRKYIVWKGGPVKQYSNVKCSLCSGVALRVVEKKYFCALHTDEAFAEARRASSPRTNLRMSRDEWIRMDYAKRKENLGGIPQ